MNENEKKYSVNEIRVIIGLGNPGQKYYKTRHNIGFRVIDEIAKQYSVMWQQNNIMEYSEIKIFEDQLCVILIKPLTFMNNSGKVISCLHKKGIKPEQIIVIHDELEKPFGKVRIKLGGSAKGHNGLRSIIEVMGKDFWRLCFGIGRPEEREMVGNYVLQPFSKYEEEKIQLLIEESIKSLLREEK